MTLRKTALLSKTWSFSNNTLRNEDVPIHRTKGENRKRMKRHLQEEYKRRPIVETVHSLLKRKGGSFVRSTPELAEKEID